MILFVPEPVPTIEAKINLSRLSSNLNLIRKKVSQSHPRGVTIMAVVKSNAYGHGLIPISRHLYREGIRHFAVARLEEALTFRTALPKAYLLILSPILPENFGVTLKNKISLTVTEKGHLPLLNRIAKKQKTKAKIHLKVDTGLNRSGVEPEEVLPFLSAAASLKHLKIEGIFTHFANADDAPFSRRQLKIFNTVIAQVKQANLLPKYVHAAATGSIFKYPDSHFNLVRPGLGLYGHFPGDGRLNLKPILSLHTHISRTHQIKKGETVGYNRTYKAGKNLLAATLSAGYADGLRRAPASWPYVQIHNQVAPIIGRMSMDQAVIDISNIKPIPTLKTKVILIADKKISPVSLEKIAEKIGTSPYEVLTSFHERVTRTYTL